MKKVSSVVWQFFDRLEENGRCVAVLCKLCDTEYKYFGNTTNLRCHLIKKHPLQWEFRQNSSDIPKASNSKGLEGQPLVRAYEGDYSTNTDPETSKPKRRKTVKRAFENVGAPENSEAENNNAETEDDEATLNLVRQMHDSQESDEEWLDDDYDRLDTYEPSPKKPRKKIKREVVTPPRHTSSFKYITKRFNKPHITEKAIEEPRRDEFDVFGEYVANKLRKFKTPRTRGNIQQIITTILWQAEYGLYDDAESVKRVLFSSSQYANEANEIEEQLSTAQESDVNNTVVLPETSDFNSTL